MQAVTRLLIGLASLSLAWQASAQPAVDSSPAPSAVPAKSQTTPPSEAGTPAPAQSEAPDDTGARASAEGDRPAGSGNDSPPRDSVPPAAVPAPEVVRPLPEREAKAGVAPVAADDARPEAAAAVPADAPVVESFSGQLGAHQRHFFLWLGVRNDFVRDSDFDQFATDDSLPAFSLGAGAVVYTLDKLSLAAFGLWEVASRNSEVRGDETELTIQRIAAGPEVRYHLHYRVYVLGRLGLGAEWNKATRRSALFDGDLVSKSWLFSSSLSAGAAVEVLGSPAGERRKPRAWVVADAGYALTSTAKLNFEPEPGSSGIPERTQPDQTGELSLSAPMFRVALAGTY